jgi:hypothetical protein
VASFTIVARLVSRRTDLSRVIRSARPSAKAVVRGSWFCGLIGDFSGEGPTKLTSGFLNLYPHLLSVLPSPSPFPIICIPHPLLLVCHSGKTEGVVAARPSLKHVAKGDGDGRQMRRLQADQRKALNRQTLVDSRRLAAGSAHGPPKLVVSPSFFVSFFVVGFSHLATVHCSARNSSNRLFTVVNLWSRCDWRMEYRVWSRWAPMSTCGRSAPC